MNLLLDTHALLWYISGDKRLPQIALKQINDENNRCLISVASLWEIAIKLSLNKLEVKGGFDTIEDFLNNNEFEVLPIEFAGTREVLKLPWHHRDPFDRMIIAHAILTSSTIVTKDQYFEEYEVELMW